MHKSHLPLFLLPWVIFGCIDEVPFAGDTTGDTTGEISQNGDTTPGLDSVGDVTSAPRVTITPNPLIFGNPGIAIAYTKEIRITNDGDSDATITHVALQAPNEGDIWELVTFDGVAVRWDEGLVGLPKVLAPGAFIALQVGYENLMGTGSAASLVVEVDGLGAPISAELRAVMNTPAPDHCVPDMLTLDRAAFGAVAVAPWGKAYIVAAESSGGITWRLAEVDLEAPSLTPIAIVEEGGFAGIQSDWIEIEGDEVSVYEFYPAGQIHAYNRVTGAVTRRTPAVSPGYETILSSRRGNVTWGVRVGSGPDDICGNVCIVKTVDGGEMEVFLDDAGDGYKIHTNHVSWFGDHVYFMSYNNPVGNGAWAGAFRRANLDTGVVEVILTLDPAASNAWVQRPVLGEDGRLYWIRIAHDGQQNRPAAAAIDAFDPVTGTLASNHVPNLGAGPRRLAIANHDTLVWVDAEGIRKAYLEGGDASVLLPLPYAAGGTTSLYTTIVGSAIYYTASTGMGEDGEAATFGCVPVDDPARVTVRLNWASTGDVTSNVDLDLHFVRQMTDPEPYFSAAWFDLTNDAWPHGNPNPSGFRIGANPSSTLAFKAGTSSNSETLVWTYPTIGTSNGYFAIGVHGNIASGGEARADIDVYVGGRLLYRRGNVLVGQDQMWSVGRIVFSGRNGSDPINFWSFTDFEQGGQPTVFNDVRP